MSRLADIIERNQHANRRSRERVYVSLFFGCAILLIIGLMVFTDLGKPPMPTRAPTSATVTAPDGAGSNKVTAPAPHDKRVDGVLLLRRASSPPPQGAAAGSSH